MLFLRLAPPKATLRYSNWKNIRVRTTFTKSGSWRQNNGQPQCDSGHSRRISPLNPIFIPRYETSEGSSSIHRSGTENRIRMTRGVANGNVSRPPELMRELAAPTWTSAVVCSVLSPLSRRRFLVPRLSPRCPDKIRRECGLFTLFSLAHGFRLTAVVARRFGPN